MTTGRALQGLAAWHMRGVAAFLAAACACGAYAQDCTWYLDTKGDQFERAALAQGYARVRMYEESFAVLAELAGEDLGPHTRELVDGLLGHNHYMTKALEEAHFHYLRAATSGLQPRCRMPGLWKTIAEVAFEAGRFEDAAHHAEAWRDANAAFHADFEHLDPLSPDDLLLIAKHWSHVDRHRALAYVDMALADAEQPFDVLTRVWIQRLREGEAPAEIPPLERPWLARPPVSLSALEVMRQVEIWQERRQLLAQPARPPEALGGEREAWTSDWQSMTLDALMQPPEAAVEAAPQAPALPPPSPGANETVGDDRFRPPAPPPAPPKR